MKKLIALCTAMLIILSVGAVGFAAEPAAAAPAAQTAEAAAPEATAFPNYFAQIKTVDIYGQDFDAYVFDGKPAMLNIWADWCPPCRSELPSLNKLAEQYSDRISIIGLLPETVEVKDGKLVQLPDKMKAARDIYAEMNIAFPSIVPEEILYTILGQVGIKAFPTTLFVDGEGRLVHLVEGAMAEEDWVQTINSVLDAIEQAKKDAA